MAALRLIGGSAIAGAIAELTGVSRKHIKHMARKAANDLQQRAGHEFRELDTEDVRDLVEPEVVTMFTRAAKRRPEEFAVAMLMGEGRVVDLVIDDTANESIKDWSLNEKGYFHTLVSAICSHARDWYLNDPKGQSYAIVSTVAETLRQQQRTNSELHTVAEGLDEVATRGDLDRIGRPPGWVRSGTDDAAETIVIVVDPHSPDSQRCRRFALWVRWVLEEHGFTVHGETPSGDPRELVIQVSISPTERSAPPPHDGKDNAEDLVTLSFGKDGTLEGASGARAVAHHIIGHVAPLVQGRIVRRTAELDYDATTSLPRLRRLTTRAIHDAGKVGQRSFDDPSQTGSLYVTRDLESRVMSQLQTKDLIVISGEAGSGKTSLLWGLAQQLVNDPERDVYVLKASYLIADEHQPGLVHAAVLADAVRARGRVAESIVLIDTADLLVNDQRSFAILMDLVDAVRAAGGRVVITSRPAEALVITAGTDRPLDLRAFATTSTTPGRSSEFVRAVRSHAVAYCGMPGDNQELVEQLMTAAVRGTPLGVLAQLPLSLRMLFELYAPGTIPEDVNSTGMFERFWAHRVTTDRRSWSDDRPEDTGRDLSTLCTTLAAAMVRTGLPEIPLDQINATENLLAELHLAQQRGIGTTTKQNTFRFFHQTFFEFAAARFFLEHEDGLTQVVQRSSDHRNDYFLAAVAEQTWVLAWRQPDRLAEAEHLALEHLRHGDGVLLRRVLRVLAQVQLTEPAADLISDTLQTAEMSMVAEYLRLLPRPGSPWQDVDTNILATAHSSGQNAAQDLVLDILNRLASISSAIAMTVTENVAEASARSFVDDNVVSGTRIRELLARLCPDHGARVLQLMDRCGVGTTTPLSPMRLKDILEILTNCRAEALRQAVAWAEAVARPMRPKERLISALADLYAAALADEAALIKTCESTLSHLRTSLLQIENENPAPIETIAFAQAVLKYTAHHASDYDMQQLLDELIARSDPQLHERIHHGWLTPLINHSTIARTRLGNALAEGLPANRSDPKTAQQRWADTVRRALSRPEIEADALSEVLAHAVGAIDKRSPTTEGLWLHEDQLLWLLLIAADLGRPDALATLRRLRDNQIALPKRSERILIQQGQHLSEQREGTGEVVEFLVARAAYVELFQLISRIPSLPWTAQLAKATQSGLLHHASTGNLPDRVRAMRLMVLASRNGYVQRPLWELLESLTTAPNEGMRAELSDLLLDGLLAGDYPFETVMRYLRPWTNESSDANRRKLRCNLIHALATAGARETIPEALDLAFGPSADSSTITPLIGYLNQPARSGPHIPMPDIVDLIIKSGQRLNDPGLPGRVWRDVPAEWRGVLSHVLNRATDDQLHTIVAAVPTMAPRFAESLLGQLPARSNSTLRTLLTQIRDNTNSPDRVSRKAGQILERTRAPIVTGWPHLMTDLRGVTADR